MIAERLETLLRGHDWHYRRSDDPGAWRAGETQRREIERLLALVPLEVAVDLWRRHAPSGIDFPLR